MGIKIDSSVCVVWFRRDLRFEDHMALFEASKGDLSVVLLFIFDTQILNQLHYQDRRIGFIYNRLLWMNQYLKKHQSSMLIKFGHPLNVWDELLCENNIKEIYVNEDYEPYGMNRDQEVKHLCTSKGVGFNSHKDHVIFAKDEIVKNDGLPYTVFTPYKKKWLQKFTNEKSLEPVKDEVNYYKATFEFPSLKEIGFSEQIHQVRDFNLSKIGSYHLNRDYPSKSGTSYLGPHLRFGTVSVRYVVSMANELNPVFLSELIWREFFMQILYHFPYVVDHNFKRNYDFVHWRNSEVDFDLWCKGETGFPLVDAGMRQMNQTGYMHNRVRMVTAGFLCKHLLIDWKWGEAYFASKLLDYELSSNNGNWQWAAGTGCDAAPYFRVFNPVRQQELFDPKLEYVKKWIPEYGTSDYPSPMVNHQFARERAIKVYKDGIHR